MKQPRDLHLKKKWQGVSMDNGGTGGGEKEEGLGRIEK